MANSWLRRNGLWGWVVLGLFLWVVGYGIAEDLGMLTPASAAPGRSKPAKGRPSPGIDAKTDIPRAYLAAYKLGAKQCRGLSWRVLAAIGKHETNHGRGWPPAWENTPGIARGTENYAHAGGPMQFIPPTWAQYGRGGDRYDYRDAIPAAARLLCNNGAPGRLHDAVFAYNHDNAYVARVLATAGRYRG